MMNKLGFAIGIADEGYCVPYKSDNGEWTRKVVDIRQYLRYFEGLKDTECFQTFLSFDANGCYLTILKWIPGRPGDYLSGWIYIPNTIEISGKEIEETSEYVIQVLNSIKGDIPNKGKIDEHFQKTYPVIKYNILYESSAKEESFGYIELNRKYSFKELMEYQLRWQSVYSRYKAIFLIDGNSGVSLAEGYKSRFSDLTDEIEELYILTDFSEADKKRLHIDKIVDEKGQEVHFPAFYVKGARVTLYVKRNGFERQTITFDVSKECMGLPANLVHGWEKVISPEIFKIVDKNGNALSGNIWINDKPMNNTDMLLLEDKCRKANVRISVFGYDSVTETLNLLKESLPPITLHREMKNKSWNIYLKNNELAEMTLKSKELAEYNPPKDSPLAGYSYDKHKDALCVDSGFVWKQRFLGILYFILTLAILVGLFYGYQWLESYGTIPSDAEVADTTQVEDKPFTDQAIAYMDNNKIWDKDSLHNYMGNDTLYNSINEYNFEYLVGLDASDCKSLRDVVDCASKVYNERLNVKGKFSEDGNITISKWIDKVKNKLKAGDKMPEKEKADDEAKASANKEDAAKKETHDAAAKNGSLANKVKDKQKENNNKSKQKTPKSTPTTNKPKAQSGGKNNEFN